MTHYYLDSSALTKRYVAETGTAWVNNLHTDQVVRASLSLSGITFVCADDQLNVAAMAEGLLVENPNKH